MPGDATYTPRIQNALLDVLHNSLLVLWGNRPFLFSAFLGYTVVGFSNLPMDLGAAATFRWFIT